MERTWIRGPALFSQHLHATAQKGRVPPTELLSRKKRDHPGALRFPGWGQRMSGGQLSPPDNAQKSCRGEPTWLSEGRDLSPGNLPVGSPSVLRLEWWPCRVPPGTSVHTQGEACDHGILVSINSVEGTCHRHLKYTGPFICLQVSSQPSLSHKLRGADPVSASFTAGFLRPRQCLAHSRPLVNKGRIRRQTQCRRAVLSSIVGQADRESF